MMNKHIYRIIILIATGSTQPILPPLPHEIAHLKKQQCNTTVDTRNLELPKKPVAIYVHLQQQDDLKGILQQQKKVEALFKLYLISKRS